MENLNQTTPEQSGNSQQPLNYEMTSLVFASALNLIFDEGEGIVVDVRNGVEIDETTEKIIVFKYQEQIYIHKCVEDLPEGTPVKINTSNEPQEEIEP